MSRHTEYIQRQELLRRQDAAIDAVAVPTVKVVQDTDGFDVQNFVSHVTGLRLPHVRTRLDAITGWPGTAEVRGHDRLLYMVPESTETPKRLRVNETHEAAAALLTAETIMIGDVQLPMPELQDMIAEQVGINTLTLAAMTRQASYARWPEMPI